MDFKAARDMFSFYLLVERVLSVNSRIDQFEDLDKLGAYLVDTG